MGVAVRLRSFRGFLARVLAGAVLTAVALAPTAVSAKGPPPALPSVTLAALPPEATAVMGQIRSGGPFRYDRDGIVFGNREKILPLHPRGYYREYTVPTPSAKNRGARRIVCGGPPTTPEACYYTGDHYQSFARIQP